MNLVFSGKEGIAHFMEHIAFRHTKTKSSRQIAEGFESVGAYANAYTTQEHTCFYVRTLTKHFSKTFKLLTDITLNPVFRKKDIEKEFSFLSSTDKYKIAIFNSSND